MEKYAMVKSEVQENGDIFLFYVDENCAQESVVTLNQNELQQLQENYVLEEVPVEDEEERPYEETVPTTVQEQPVLEETGSNRERWLDEETKKLLIFYIDNKETFVSNPTRRKHLLAVACKAMLTGKNPTACEMKLRYMKKKYALLCMDAVKRRQWAHYELCHQAFQGDSYVRMLLNENANNAPPPVSVTKNEDGVISLKKVINKPQNEKIMQMLNLYLQSKREAGKDISWQKYVWEKIAKQLGEDSDFWHKRFLNFKQHYIRLLEKRAEDGPDGIAWPYVNIFDSIYKDDAEFQRRYAVQTKKVTQNTTIEVHPHLDWDDTEKTVLVKYCFDCYDEFQDPTIPKTFLWNEIGRLLDKQADNCQKKYDELKEEHLNAYLEGGYNIRLRKPVAILFDNIICKEVERQLTKFMFHNTNTDLLWETDKFDELVQFFFDNIELFKDPTCHFVCWAAIAGKMSESVETCREQWHQLTLLYKTILDEKKEDSDLQIDWRYIELFDRIFDYGMDTKLLEGYEKTEDLVVERVVEKRPHNADDMLKSLSDYEDFDDKGTGKRSRGTEDPKAVKILEYYFKNKDRFATTQRKKNALWEVLAKQLGVTAEQCAHRLRNLKQIYTAYIQKEINKPDMPVLWPYYCLCKKVFGYRAIKNKLKNGKMEFDDTEEWSTKEIKMLVNYAASNFNDINDLPDETSHWQSISKEVNKSETSCRDKFLDLRKSYRKIRTMMNKNPDCKVTWKFFKLLDGINSREQNMEVDSADDNVILTTDAIKTELTDDDDIQCIIVIPEGQEMGDLNAAQIIVQDKVAPVEKPSPKRIIWYKKDKIKLLKLYYQYLKENEGKLIDIKKMWQAIGKNFKNRSCKSCRKMCFQMKMRYKKMVQDNNFTGIPEINDILKDIFELKPKFVRTPLSADEIVLREQTTYKDVSLPLWKVEKALTYYLEHVEEFVDPKYDRKYSWIDLAKNVELPVSKIFRKINYLKQFYNSETNEVNGEKVEFGATLKEILEKEFICNIAVGNLPEPTAIDAEDATWTDDEIEQLLLWYLVNLDKFKNPKYVSSYLWLEASQVLNKSPTVCSAKMTEVRKQYSAMVKENASELNNWRFYELCQKIYGTGKRSPTNEENSSM